MAQEQPLLIFPAKKEYVIDWNMINSLEDLKFLLSRVELTTPVNHMKTLIEAGVVTEKKIDLSIHKASNR
jgi:hypothetical protein